MAFDPDEYLKGSKPTTTEEEVTPAPAETKATVSGFDPDAYLKGVSPSPAAPGAAPTGFDPDKYLSGIPSVQAAPKETGMFADAKNYIKDQADILGADLRIGAINTGIAVDNLKLAGLMEIQEGRKAKYGDNLEAMPEDVRKDHIATGKAIQRMLGQVAQSSMRIKEVERTTGVRETTKAFNDIRQTPEYQAAPFMTQAKMVGEKFVQDPIGIITDLGLQSLPQSLGIAATAVMARVGLLSPTAAATAGGATSAMMEFGNQYAQLREEGMNHKEAWEKAGVKSGVIGIFDGVSFKLAGSAAEDVMRNISKGAFKETAKTVAKETGKQAGLGAAGEAVSSVAIGKPIDPGEVLAEAVGEVFGAPGEAVSTYRSQNVPKAVAPTAAGVVTPAAPIAAAPIAPEAPPSESFKTDEMMAEVNRMKTEPISAAPLVMPEVVAPVATTVTPEATFPTDTPQTFKEFISVVQQQGVDTKDPEVMKFMKETWEQQKPSTDQTFENIERSQIKTPQFQQWFGESKVKDEAGVPKVMYHGTKSDIQEFQPRNGLIFVSPDSSFSEIYAEPSIYKDRINEFTGQEQTPNVMPVYVQAKNIFDFDNPNHVEKVVNKVKETIPNYQHLDEIKDGSWPILESEQVRNAVKSLGFDSMYIQEKGRKNLAVFEPTQIKSAIGNKGTFNPESGNISENFERLTSRNSYAGEEATRAPSYRVEMNRLGKEIDQGKITAEEYVNSSKQALEATKKQTVYKDRVRGMDQILSRIRQEVSRKKLDPKAADFAEWFLKKNPALADDIGISIKSPKGDTGVSGFYGDLSRVITLFQRWNQHPA